MAPSFNELFAKLTAGAGASWAALDAILRMGPAVVPDLIKLVTERRATYDASVLLAWLQVPDRIALLTPLVRHADSMVNDVALRALPGTRDRRAVALAIECAKRNPALVITVLGDLGFAEGIDEIRSILEREVGDIARSEQLSDLIARAITHSDVLDLLLIAAGAESLAKLGDFSLAGAACELSRFVASDELPEACLVRLAAVRAIDVCVAPGVADVLAERLDDPDGEVREAAMLATLHLGRTRFVERWLVAGADRDGELEFVTRRCFEDLIGERPPETADEARIHWQARASTFDAAICYRRGKPATPSVLLRDLQGPDSVFVLDEVRQMSGLGFIQPGFRPPPAEEIEAIATWWFDHGRGFTPGKLHRWGRTYAADACD